MNPRHPVRDAIICVVSITIAVVLTAVAPSPAAAAPDYPEAHADAVTTPVNQRPLADPYVDELVTIALDLHAADGHVGPRPAVLVADSIETCWTDEATGGRRCTDNAGSAPSGGPITILGASIRYAKLERWRYGYGGDSDREDLCTIVAHEVGHSLGLPHAEHGVMSYDGSIPAVCHQWRLELDRPVRAAYRAKRAQAAAKRARARGERAARRAERRAHRRAGV